MFSFTNWNFSHMLLCTIEVEETRSVFADHYNVDLPLQSTPAWCHGRADISVSLPREAEVWLVRGLNLSARALKLVPWGCMEAENLISVISNFSSPLMQGRLTSRKEKSISVACRHGERIRSKGSQSTAGVWVCSRGTWVLDSSRYVITLLLYDQRKLLKICRGL